MNKYIELLHKYKKENNTLKAIIKLCIEEINELYAKCKVIKNEV